MKCCPVCIGDSHLSRQVFPGLSSETGTCSYCCAKNQMLISPKELRDSFELVTSVYKSTDSGEKLADLLSRDWAMFNATDIEKSYADQLLADILDDETYLKSRFTPSSKYKSDSINRWGEFRSELMHENRYFPKVDIDLDQLRSLLPHLLLAQDDLPSIWYRVRIQDGDKAFPSDEMGAPPGKRASHGRANPAGIPYLYLATTRTTAITEVRPHTGENASVAQFQIADGLKIIDLEKPRHTVSPFVLEDEDDIGLLRADIGFLEQLGEELSRPVVPNSAAVDYTPSQFLCEYIKNCGYDGVQYKSSMEEGVNLALFRPSAADVVSVEVHEVTRVSVLHKPITI